MMLACAAAAAFCAGALQVPSWLDAPPKSVLSTTKTTCIRHAPAAEWVGRRHGGGLHNASYVGGSEAGGWAEIQRNPPAPCEPPCAAAGRHSPCTRFETPIARTADAVRVGLPNFCKCIGRAASGLGAQPGNISNDELVAPVTDSSTRGWNASAAAAAPHLSAAGCDRLGRAEVRALEVPRINLIADAAGSIHPTANGTKAGAWDDPLHGTVTNQARSPCAPILNLGQLDTQSECHVHIGGQFQQLPSAMKGFGTTLLQMYNTTRLYDYTTEHLGFSADNGAHYYYGLRQGSPPLLKHSC